ncbi:MAG: DUF742 domain-containing protein [Pseudonocardiaceae bacterium]
MSRLSGDDGDDQSFADVLNNLSGGPWSSGWRRKKLLKSARGTGTARQPAPVEAPCLARRPAPTLAGSDEWSEPAVSASVVRPYTWTRGRTSPVLDLAVETLVSTAENGPDTALLVSEEHRSVAELCRAPRSVAEVAALLSLPLGVARVLLADMADTGLVVVHRGANGSGDMPDMALMERVLSGLRRL